MAVKQLYVTCQPLFLLYLSSEWKQMLCFSATQLQWDEMWGLQIHFWIVCHRTFDHTIIGLQAVWTFIIFFIWWCFYFCKYLELHHLWHKSDPFVHFSAQFFLFFLVPVCIEMRVSQQGSRTQTVSWFSKDKGLLAYFSHLLTLPPKRFLETPRLKVLQKIWTCSAEPQQNH